MTVTAAQRYKVLAGAVLLHLTFGTVSTSGNLIPYLVSYMRMYVDQSVDHAKIEWVAATSQMSLGAFSILGGFMMEKLGTRTTCFIGCVIFCYNLLLSYSTLHTSYLLLIGTDGIGVGMGVSLAYTTSLYAAVEWFPSHRGLATGLITGSYYLGFMVSMLLQTACLNPLDVSSTTDGYFEDEDLLQRVPWLFPWTALGCFLIEIVALWYIDGPARPLLPLLPCTLAASHEQSDGSVPSASKDQLSCSGSPTKDTSVGSRQTAALQHDLHSNTPLLEGIAHQEAQDNTATSAQQPHCCPATLGVPDLTPREMLDDCKFRIILPTYILNSVVNVFIITSYKSFAETIVYDDSILTDLECLGALATVLGSVVWGLILDKTSYKTTMLAITSLLTVLMGTLPLACHYWRWAFTVYGLSLYFSASGTYAIMPAVISAAYGPRHAVKNMAVLLGCRSLSALLVAVCLQFFLQYGGYYGFCSIQAIFTFIALILTVSFPANEQPT